MDEVKLVDLLHACGTKNDAATRAKKLTIQILLGDSDDEDNCCPQVPEVSAGRRRIKGCRFEKMRGLLIKNNYFRCKHSLRNPDAIIDHFTVLSLLNDAYLYNGQGKGEKYPRYLKIFIGQGLFSDIRDINTNNLEKATVIARRHVERNIIATQTIRVGNERVNAMLAPAKHRNTLIKRLTRNFLYGFKDYAKLLRKLESKTLVIPEPADHRKTGREAICDPQSPTYLLLKKNRPI